MLGPLGWRQRGFVHARVAPKQSSLGRSHPQPLPKGQTSARGRGIGVPRGCSVLFGMGQSDAGRVPELLQHRAMRSGWIFPPFLRVLWGIKRNAVPSVPSVCTVNQSQVTTLRHMGDNHGIPPQEIMDNPPQESDCSCESRFGVTTRTTPRAKSPAQQPKQPLHAQLWCMDEH